MKKFAVVAGIVTFFLIVFLFMPQAKIAKEYVVLKVKGKKTVADRMAEFGPAVEARLSPQFQSAGVSFPPNKVTYLAFKFEKLFEVYAANATDGWKKICSYPILAASGNLGPKLQEGDRQVPEGIYRIESFNPNSLFHLSIKVNYPNDLDKANALIDKRDNLGGDIMIHGNQMSIGCIALGDQAAEDIFVLTSMVGREHVKVIISPIDFRTRSRSLPASIASLPKWTKALYHDIDSELQQY